MGLMITHMILIQGIPDTSHYSWVDQALENQCNIHWAFGTIGLPSWLTTDEHTVNSIFQIRSNMAREIMEVAWEHLIRDNLRLTADAETILDSVTSASTSKDQQTTRGSACHETYADLHRRLEREVRVVDKSSTYPH